VSRVLATGPQGSTNLPPQARLNVPVSADDWLGVPLQQAGKTFGVLAVQH